MTGDIFSRLIWCMMPLPAGITSTLSNAELGPVDEVEAVLVAPVLDRTVLLRTPPGSKPPHSTASE